ncbi:ferredoxin-nitrate reductase [Synechococcus elongatus PCC 6301]|uniref:Ferredoxin-nitrate reductase n=1 Tax=Synechococcus sp. (strain ATCC 27144 / PCC 6301 / SAUG 1402/1) TaxID=269084 RepID=A0A0H3JZV4_SYNP6|nr:nitrate reductase catalytic subunit [Synechococcus elongatus]BAD78505.1 ferredoxin-nitrate reductase [Synechococcus elongatus PCC 6301]
MFDLSKFLPVITPLMIDTAKTLCPYCGVGCGLEAVPPAQPGRATVRDREGTPIWQIRGDRQHPSSQGMVCVKGATVAESVSKSRLKYPMFRASLDDPFTEISWDEALDRLCDRIQQTQADYGKDGICFYGSGQFQTEDYYIAQKLVKGCLGTNNFDTNSRLCMSSAVSAYSLCLGSDGPPACYEDLDLADCLLIVGSNTAECHPILFNRYRKRHKQGGTNLIVVDPRCTPTAEVADLHLALKPGSDVALLNGLGWLLYQMGYVKKDFIANQTEGFEDWLAIIEDYPPQRTAELTGLAVAELVRAADLIASAQRWLSLWSMGVNQSIQGTAKATSLINLHLLTRQIGLPGCGPFSLTGRPNAMGGRETGGLAHLLPGYRKVIDPQHRADVETIWGLPMGSISPQPGRTAWQMIEGLEQGAVGFLWVAATNPAVSLPDVKRAQAALKRSPFTVLQDAYHPTETTTYAHLLLPAAQWSEKTGTMTNSERRVTLCQAFRQPPGEARADWQIFAEVGRRLGFAFDYTDAAAVFAEYVQVTAGRLCDLSGLSHELLAQAGPQQWPFPAGAEPTTESKRLYTKHHFAYADGRARFQPFHHLGVAEPPDDRYPLVLTVGRLYGHWHTQTRTGRIDKINKLHPSAFVEIHPRDADRYNISEGQAVVIRSRRGEGCFPAKVTTAISPGVLFVPMHWGALWGDRTEANALTHPAACPISGEPELKACAVQIEAASSTFTI